MTEGFADLTFSSSLLIWSLRSLSLSLSCPDLPAVSLAFCSSFRSARRSPLTATANASLNAFKNPFESPHPASTNSLPSSYTSTPSIVTYTTLNKGSRLSHRNMSIRLSSSSRVTSTRYIQGRVVDLPQPGRVRRDWWMGLEIRR